MKSAADVDRFKELKVPPDWCIGFTWRHSLKSIRLHGEAGIVSVEKLAIEIGELCDKLQDFLPECI